MLGAGPGDCILEIKNEAGLLLIATRTDLINDLIITSNRMYFIHVKDS